MPFVLDASIAACWAFPDGQDPRAEEALARIRTEDAIVPSLWRFEVRNVEASVLKLARTRRLSVHDAAYLELALRGAAPLATLDAQLAAAAVAEGVQLVGAR